MEETKSWMQSLMTNITELGEIEMSKTTLQINDEDVLKTKLTEVIAYLIDHNFEKLLLILYRIDVDEERTKVLLSKNLPEAAPSLLAEIIIQRQIIKEAVKKSFQYQASDLPEDDDLRL